jgi:hypothetical protein
MMAIAYVYIEFPNMTVDEVQEKYFDSMEVDYLVIPEEDLHRNEKGFVFVLADIWESGEK